LKLTLAADSLEENRLTGTETSPKEIVADPMDLAAIVGVVGLVSGLDIPAESGHRKAMVQGGWCRILHHDLVLWRNWSYALVTATVNLCF
jgi:hypothetical protein